MSNANEGHVRVVTAARGARRARLAALAGLLGAGLWLVPLAAEAGPARLQPAATPAAGAQPPAGPRKESPYARYAREHAKVAGAKRPALVKPTLHAAGRGARGPARR